MEAFLCGSAIAGIIVISLFFYLLNTARKKVKTTNDFGKKNYAPVYVSIADKPDAIIRGMMPSENTIQISTPTTHRPTIHLRQFPDAFMRIGRPT